MIAIPGSASGLVLGFLLATAYGAAFHLFFGGSIRQVALYLLAAWFGFLAGQLVGDLVNFEVLKLGKIHLLSASAGAWLMLLLVWWLSGQPRAAR